MICEESNTYTFKNNITKVHYFCPAFDNSVVIIALHSVGKDVLQHYNKDGTLIYEYNFGDFVDTLCMPDDHTAIVLRPEDSQILIFDLFSLQNTKQEPKRYRNDYMVDVSCQVYLHFFCETNLLAIQENGDHEQIQMRLCYFKWPL